MRAGYVARTDGGGFRHIGAETLGKHCRIICVNVCVPGRAGNGYVGKAGIEEFGECLGVHIDKDAVFGQTWELWLVTA